MQWASFFKTKYIEQTSFQTLSINYTLAGFNSTRSKMLCIALEPKNFEQKLKKGIQFSSRLTKIYWDICVTNCKSTMTPLASFYEGYNFFFIA